MYRIQILDDFDCNLYYSHFERGVKKAQFVPFKEDGKKFRFFLTAFLVMLKIKFRETDFRSIWIVEA